MLTFLINNPERFACDLVVWPASVTFVKVITTVGAQTAAILNMIFMNNAFLLIKWYASFAVIASLDGKLKDMISSVHSTELGGSSIDALPLEIGVFQFESSLNAIKNIWIKYQ